MATLGDRAKNARRAAERRLHVLNVDLAMAQSERERAGIERNIARFRSLIEETRFYGADGRRIAGRTTEQREAAVKSLESLNVLNPSRGANRQMKSNAIFMQNVRQVSQGENIENMSETEMRVFWRATQHIWEGAPVDERYERILSEYGTGSLMDVFEAVIAENEDIIKIIEKRERGERLTAEEKSLLLELKRKEDEQEKRYKSGNEDSPLVGSIASNVRPFTRSDFMDYVASREDFED